MSWKEELAKIFLYDTDKGKTKPDGSPATEEGEGNYLLDPRKIAAMLGFGLSASGALAPKDPPVGYQGTVPKYNFVRDRVQNTYDPNRRPGSRGQRYFSTPQFVKQTDNMTGEQIGTYEDDLKAAQDAAATEVGGLETLNRENLASYPAPVTTTPEETNTGIASLPSIPLEADQLTGQVNLGMANGGIVGLKKGTFSDFISNLGSGIKDTASNIGSSIKDMGSGMYKDVVYGPMQGPNLPSETHGSLANLDNPFGKTSYDYGPFTLSTDGTTAEQHFGQSDAEEERSKAYANYKRAIGAGAGEGVSQDYVRGRSDARAENFLGGQNYDAVVSQNEATPGSHDMSVYNNPLTSKVINGTTLVGYENEDGLFQPISYNDANRALDAGIVDNPDIMGTNNTTTDNTTTDNTTNTTTDNTSGPTGPTDFTGFLSAIDTGSTSYTGLSDNVTSFADTIGTDLSPTVVTTDILPITTHYSNLPSEEKETFYNLISSGDVVTNVTDPETGEVTSVPIPQNKLNAYKKWLDYINTLGNEALPRLIEDLTILRDFTGVSGQAGTGGAAYGGAIKGYAMGGMGEPPQGLSASPGLPSGLLKSNEDGMADTIPAQMGEQPINLSGGEYIMDAETVAFLGNGNTDAGAQKLDDFRETLRMAKNGGEDQGNQINSENFLGRLQQVGVA